MSVSVLTDTDRNRLMSAFHAEVHNGRTINEATRNVASLFPDLNFSQLKSQYNNHYYKWKERNENRKRIADAAIKRIDSEKENSKIVKMVPIKEQKENISFIKDGVIVPLDPVFVSKDKKVSMYNTSCGMLIIEK